MATNPPISIINTLNIDQSRALLLYARDCAARDASALADFRTLLRYRDQAYQRQLNVTAEHVKAVRANMSGDARKMPDITVPIVMPQVESAVAYQAGVFLSSYPIFGVVGTPENQTQALQFETALGDQSVKYGWARELIKVFRDGYKFNFGAAVVAWKNTPLRSVVTDTSISAAGLAKINNASYGGNCIERLDPYNCFMDMSVAPADLHTQGEYFGWNKPISRIELKRLLATLDPRKTMQATEAFKSQFAGNMADSQSGVGYHIPEINKYMNLGTPASAGQNWGQWMGLPGFTGRNGARSLEYKNHYILTHFYCRALPGDFGARGNQPKIYHAIIVNWSVVVFVEELNLAHDFLPCMVMQPYEDGLGYQTQSMLDNALPYQDMSSALWNISLESQRRKLFDRLIYNPRFIDKKDIDPASSVSRIPLRNASIGKDGENVMARAIYQVPYRDETAATSVQMSQLVAGMADESTGQNRVDRGQFQKGNRTKTEFDAVNGNSNSRQQLSSLMIEGQFMTPLKEVIKANTLQFQPAGKLLNRDARQVIDVDPVELRQQILEFKMTDGLLPADKMLNSELLMVFMQTAQALPAMTTEYDILGMFLYWAKTHGAYWAEDFKRDPAAQQQFLQTMQQTTAANTPPQSSVVAPAQ